MIIGILKERDEESRVSALPEMVRQFTQLKTEVWLEPGAGERAFAGDAAYVEAGATLHAKDEILDNADLILSIHIPDELSITRTAKRKVCWAGVYAPLNNHEFLERWAASGLTLLSLDNIPRISRAQGMDVVSSQASIAGYKAVLAAAARYPRYFPMLMTAAGSIAPAKVLILGAGVAGLQAIATARRLGAVVEVFDTRTAVKEEVMSLGAKFIEVEGAKDDAAAGGYAVEQDEAYQQKQQQKIADGIAKADVVITTAQIPGRPAPVLIKEEMLKAMKPGSLIVDLAAASGGNTAVTKSDETVIFNQVTIIGDSNLAASLPADASKLYGKNVLNFLKLIIDGEGNLHFDFEDEIIEGACIVHEGKIMNKRVRKFFGMEG